MRLITRPVIPFGKIEGRIVEVLYRHFGEWVRTETLVAAAYDDDPNGGPAKAERSVRSHVHMIRRKLQPHGLTIEGHSGAGRRLCESRLRYQKPAP